MEDLKTYPVLSPVLTDKRYEPGKTIDLDEDTAGPLLAVGAIGEATGIATAPASKPLPAAELIEQIKLAATTDAVDTILGTDKRATVVAAAEARKAELAG